MSASLLKLLELVQTLLDLVPGQVTAGDQRRSDPDPIGVLDLDQFVELRTVDQPRFEAQVSRSTSDVRYRT